jgi:hypothetical protein
VALAALVFVVKIKVVLNTSLIFHSRVGSTDLVVLLNIRFIAATESLMLETPLGIKQHLQNLFHVQFMQPDFWVLDSVIPL